MAKMLEKIITQQTETENQTFSIVVPISTNRQEVIHRTLRSLLFQTYPKELYEILLVIDGDRSDYMNTMKKTVLSYMKKYQRIKLAAVHPVRLERCISRNDGMKKAKNDWMCWLDSDDEYMDCYLDRMNWAINEYPDYKAFHFGAIICREGRHAFRHPLQLKENENADGMEDFKSGKIGSGSFIFKRELLEDSDIGYLPDVMDCYKLADAAKIQGYSGATQTLANPWGDDYYMFWKITRKYKSKALEFYPYINYIRRSYNAPYYSKEIV